MELDDSMFDYMKFIDLERARLHTEVKDHESSYAAYLAAQGHGCSVQAHLDSLVELMKPILDTSNEAQRHIEALRQGFETQQVALDKLVRYVPLAARKTNSADVLASKVFAIPELFERILLCLETVDLFIVQLVNHQFYDAIKSSLKVQWKMGLKPQEKCHLHCPAAYFDYRRFYCFPETLSYPREPLKERELIVKASFFNGPSAETATPGTSLKNILVCQPPLKSMNVYTRCCHPNESWRWRDSNGPLEIIRSDTGIRIGQLLEAYDRISAEHKLCPDAEAHVHDEDGFVRSRVSFEATITVDDDDPALLRRKEYDQKHKTEETQTAAHLQRMRPYIAAKQSARDNGQSIPTLAEFEAANPTE